MSSKGMKKGRTLKATVEEFVQEISGPIRDLLLLERDAAGVSRQLHGIPLQHEGAEDALAGLQRQIDRRFATTTGVDAARLSAALHRYHGGRPAFVSPDEIRDILDRIQALCAVFGVDARTAALPESDGEIWTAQSELYWSVPRTHMDGTQSARVIPLYRLRRKPRLRPDGSLISARRKK